MSDSALAAEQLATLKADLERLRIENVGDLEAATKTMADLAADHSAIDPALHEVGANAEYMIEDATQIIALIDAALARMDDGTYGACLGCGQPIDVARLELRPYGPKCVPCSG
jgi:DnaK suppressor protein